MRIIKNSGAVSCKPARLMGLVMASAVLAGCASAESRQASRADFREQQVRAIEVQAEQETARRIADSEAQAAMWESLSKAVKENPESASHYAIVMAVAAARGAAEPSDSPDTMVLQKEREVLPIDYVQVVAPALLGGLTQVGISAITNETTRASINANARVRVVESQIDGKIYDVLGAAVTNGTYSPDSSGSAVEDVTDTTPDPTPFGIDPAAPGDDVVDPTDDVVDPSEDVTETESAPQFDCSTPAFSPVSPERQAACP